MNSRDAILQRIRSGLGNAAAAGFGNVTEPSAPAVWPCTNPEPARLLSQFQMEMESLKGEFIHCPTMADACRQLATLIETAPWAHVGCLDRPLARELTSGLPTESVNWVTPDWTSQQIEQLPVGLIVADALLADTGSCVVHCTTASERLMCYLPPACTVLARAGQLAEHLPAAWAPISKICAAKESRGEIVIITGPSRTSDIEKVLILGVHGPKRLIVLLVE
jgi:L-lactate dehydrogenase complex protein LldG